MPTAAEQQAYDLGVEHAKNAASWVLDGSLDAEDYRFVLSRIEEGDPSVGYALPECPNLSGEWADSLTPNGLADSIVGPAVIDAAGWMERRTALVDALADAYEAGVLDTFEPECERILREAIA